MENTPQILSTEQVIESAKEALKAHALGEKLTEAVAELGNVATAPIAIGDQDAIKAVDTARKKAKAIRTSIERKRKELKEVALEYGKAVDSTAKELSAPIEAQERRLEAALADVQRREKEEAERAERERLERFNARTAQLFAIGVTFSGNAYELGALKASPARLDNATAEEWPGIVAKFQAEAERMAEEARRREEEAERARALEEENARLRAQLEALQRAQAKPAMEAKPEPEPVLEADADMGLLQAVADQYGAPTVLEVDAKGEVVDAVALPIVQGGKVVSAPSVELKAPKVSIPTVPIPVPVEDPAQLSESEAHLRRITGTLENEHASSFRRGYREGIAFAKQAVLAIMGDTATYDTRGKVKQAIEAL